MWSFAGAKESARWLWHALDHRTGRVLAYVVGSRKDATVLELRALLAPFGITRYYTDKAGVYRRHLPPAQHTVEKLSMQKIERKHLTPYALVSSAWPARRCVSPARTSCMTSLSGYI
jgi:insertion element IS1 protein InsB